MGRRLLSVSLLGAMAFGAAAGAQERHYDVTVKPGAAGKGFEKLSVSKAVVGTSRIQLWANTAINPDCSEIPGVTLSILQAAAHGTVSLSDEPHYPSFPPANPRSACNVRKVAGHQAFYQAAPGFSGHDRVVLEGSSPEGHVRDITFDILVR